MPQARKSSSEVERICSGVGVDLFVAVEAEPFALDGGSGCAGELLEEDGADEGRPGIVGRTRLEGSVLVDQPGQDRIGLAEVGVRLADGELASDRRHGGCSRRVRWLGLFFLWRRKTDDLQCFAGDRVVEVVSFDWFGRCWSGLDGRSCSDLFDLDDFGRICAGSGRWCFVEDGGVRCCAGGEWCSKKRALRRPCRECRRTRAGCGTYSESAYVLMVSGVWVTGWDPPLGPHPGQALSLSERGDGRQ